MIFCQIDDKLISIIKKYAKKRKVLDCGAGDGLLGSLMDDVISIDLYPERSEQLSPVFPEDATKFPINPGLFPIFIRPCHNGFPGEAIKNNKISELLYIGFKKNFRNDLGDYVLETYDIIEIPDWVGQDKEKAYYISNNLLKDNMFYKIRENNGYHEEYPNMRTSWRQKIKLPYGEGYAWQNMAGGFRPTSKDDEILEIVEAEDWESLDWRGTYLDTKHQSCGWLDRNGKWYSCGSMDHDSVAYFLLKKDINQLEKEGWVRVYNLEQSSYSCHRDLSSKQKSWLFNQGVDVKE